MQAGRVFYLLDHGNCFCFFLIEDFAVTWKNTGVREPAWQLRRGMNDKSGLYGGTDLTLRLWGNGLEA